MAGTEVIADYIEWRSHNPSDDLMTKLLTAEFEDEDGVVRNLTRAEVLTYVMLLAGAGNETTTRLIGWAGKVLADHPDQRRELVDDPSLIPNAVEEILRFDGPVLYHRRIAKVDTSIGGVQLPAGAKVLMCFASADHDPTEFGADADEFRVARADAERHLAFGKGAHLCLGAPLGRLETQISLELLTTMTPDIDLVPGQDIAYSPNALFRGVQSLLVAPAGLA
jgi:cytochrome P450